MSQQAMVQDSATVGANGVITLIKTDYTPRIVFEGIKNSPSAVTLQLGTDGSNPDLTINGHFLWHSGNLPSPFNLTSNNTISGNNTFTGVNSFNNTTNFSGISSGNITAGNISGDFGTFSGTLTVNGNSAGLSIYAPNGNISAGGQLQGSSASITNNISAQSANFSGYANIGTTNTGILISSVGTFNSSLTVNGSLGVSTVVTNSLSATGQITGGTINAASVSATSGTFTNALISSTLTVGAINSTSINTASLTATSGGTIGAAVIQAGSSGGTLFVPVISVGGIYASGNLNMGALSNTTIAGIATFYQGFTTGGACEFNGTVQFDQEIKVSSSGIRFSDGSMQYTAYTSDERLKKNIEPLANAGVEMMNNLKPVTFQWNPESPLANKDPKWSDPSAQVGFLAQDVQTLIPTAVIDNGTFLQLDPTKIIPYLVKAVQELSAQVAALQAKG